MGWFVDGVDSERQDEEEAEGENSEVRKPRRMVDPMKPTKKEVEEHEVTHLPFRNWCCASKAEEKVPHTGEREDMGACQRCTWTSCSWAQKTSLGRPVPRSPRGDLQDVRGDGGSEQGD